MELNKAVAKAEMNFIKGTPQIRRFWDSSNEKQIDILKCLNTPQNGLQVCATIGLNKIDIGLISDKKPLRAEIVGASDILNNSFENMIATTAFKIMDSHTCFPGYIVDNVIEEYIPDCEMKHFLLTDPFLWEDAQSITLDSVHIAWLMTVPISHKEYEYARINGVSKLESAFEHHNIDIYNIYRKSIF